MVFLSICTVFSKTCHNDHGTKHEWWLQTESSNDLYSQNHLRKNQELGDARITVLAKAS